MNARLQTQRRQLMKLLAAAGLTGISAGALGSSSSVNRGAGVIIPGKGWVSAGSERCEGDGTPLQFLPKTAPDVTPLVDELAKYPTCPYCGMSRARWHHSRHLVHYDDDLADGTCSIHCLAISLSLNLDRVPKAIYAADFGSDAEIKPLLPVDDASYLIGSSLKGTMSAKSKMAFATEAAAKSARAKYGGELAGFDEALRMTYLGIAEDTVRIRERRAQRRRKL
ncbi:MAG: Nitrous oxide reductase accessory protein NosL [Candidatus Kentron sp. G]|nr:MAG: Nitrous oxide reductase accessory protein NosL [Candidatus Kentron sp. G]VFN04133.1 MAG: Nitrous oxide reductase accessory protein NosL [Candidatus Kentron sp. G]VFN05441.1 MAG: Nitrous oxide reductase accessory protein NosL [Candidatus Kentron sp. G]